MSVYWRKVKHSRKKNEENLIDKGIAFLKGFLREKVDEVGDVVERKVKREIRKGMRKMR